MKMRRTIKSDDHGIALISVMVCIMLSFLLSATIMRISLLSYLQKGVAKQASSTFYENEEFLDDIKMGVQQKVAIAFTSSLSATTGEDSFADYFEKALVGTTTDESEKKAALETLLKSFISDETEGKIQNITVGDSEGHVFVRDGEDIIIKNVVIEYIDNTKNGYYSKIQTDIRVRSPYYTTTNNESSPHGKYSMIAGGGSFAYGGDIYSPGTGTVRQSGDVYIGYVDGTLSADKSSATSLELCRRMSMLYEGNVVINGDVYISDNSRLAFLGDTVEVRGDIYISSNSKLFLREGTSLTCRRIYVDVDEKSVKRNVRKNQYQDMDLNLKLIDTSSVTKENTLGGEGTYSKDADDHWSASHLPYGANQGGGATANNPDSTFNNNGPLFICSNFTPGSSSCTVTELDCDEGEIDSDDVTVTFDETKKPVEKRYDETFGKEVDVEYLKIVDTKYFGMHFDGDLEDRNYPSYSMSTKGGTHPSKYFDPTDGTTEKTDTKINATGKNGNGYGRWSSIGGNQIQVIIGHAEDVDNSHPAFILVDDALYLGDLNNNQAIYGIILSPEVVLSGAKEGTSEIHPLTELSGVTDSVYQSWLDGLGENITAKSPSPGTDYRYHLVDNFFHGGIAVLYEEETTDDDEEGFTREVKNTDKNMNRTLEMVSFENWSKNVGD